MDGTEPQHRAHFDAVVRFANGGSLTAEGFRLDVPQPDVTRDELALLLVQHLGLALVESVEYSRLEIVEEAHRGSRGTDRTSMAPTAPRRFVDLSHPIRSGLVTYPGLPAPEVTPHLTREASRERYAPGTEFAIDRISMVGNTGTYLDSPYHRYASGSDLAGLALDRLAGLPAQVFHLTDASGRGIRAETLADRDLGGTAVLLHTGWDRHFGTPDYAVEAPFLTVEGARYLVQAGAILVGIDSINIDDTDDPARPAHSLLLEAGIAIVEHLTNLDALPPTGATFSAVPPAIEAFGTFPVRALAELNGSSLAGTLQAKATKRPADESWESVRHAAWEAPDPDRRR